jgi:hypothetical protein
MRDSPRETVGPKQSAYLTGFVRCDPVLGLEYMESL